MGSFSWCYCDKDIRRDSAGYLDPTNTQRMRYGKPGHVLFPKEFGGKAAQIDVDAYEDYGRFYNEKDGKTYDVYSLVADWNREWVSKHPEWIKPSEMNHIDIDVDPNAPVRPIGEKSWYEFYSDLSLSQEEVCKRWREKKEKEFGRELPATFCSWRSIGIDIACYDEDAAEIPYPIKISRSKNAVYEKCGISYGDPYQGFA